MRVLVTGGCGYVGSSFLRSIPTYFEGEPPDIRILDNLQGGRPEALMDLPEAVEYEFFEGDVLDPSIQRAALREVDAVVHLAAIVRTPLSYEDPTWVEQVNHWGTSHLLEACLKAEVDDFVFASSAAVYGPGGPYDEEDACEPMGAYAHSKREAERAVRSAGRRGLRTTILRLGTSYGRAPVTRYEAVANRFALLAGTCRPLTVYGDGTQKRPLIHVQDAAGALGWALVNRERAAGRTLNAKEQNFSVNEVTQAVREARPDVEVRRTDQDIREHLSFGIDDSALRSLGWAPSHTITEGLGDVVSRLRGFSVPSHLTRGQIGPLDV